MSLSIRWQIATAVMVVSLVSLTIGSAVALVDSRDQLEAERSLALDQAEEAAEAELATLWYRAQGRLLGLEAAMDERTDEARFAELVASLGILDGDLAVVALYNETGPIAQRPPMVPLDGRYSVSTPSGAVRGELAANMVQNILIRVSTPLGPGGTVSWIPDGDGRTVDGLGGTVVADAPPIDAAQMYSGVATASNTGLIVAGGTFLGGLVVAGLVMRPLRQLQRTVDSLVDGADQDSDFKGPREFQDIAQHIRSAAQEVQREREASTRLQQELDSEVQRRGDALQDRDATLSALFQGISHDVKGPLISATGLMGRLAREEDPDKRALILDRCASSLRKLGHAVDQMVHFSRSLQGGDNEVVEVDTLLKSCISSARRSAVGMGRHVNAQGGHAVAYCDPTRLEVAMTMLLDNAFRHGGNVEVSWGGDPLSIVIQDDGPGIPYSVESLVEPYMVRANAPGVMAGMGLAIAHRMVTGMGGRLDIQTGAEGTRCLIELPVVAP